jgi:hypothetical protein
MRPWCPLINDEGGSAIDLRECMMPGRLPGDDVEALIYMDALAAALRTVSDFRVDIVPAIQSSAAFLRVANPHATDLAEEIYCAPGVGAWWFTWSWGDRIGLAADIEGAANAIRHVLRVRRDLLAVPAKGPSNGRHWPAGSARLSHALPKDRPRWRLR